MRYRSNAALLALGFMTPVLAGCEREAEPGNKRVEPATTALEKPQAAPTPPRATASVQPPSAEQPFSGQDLSMGNWIETSAYKVRVSSVIRCADPEPSEEVPVDRPLRIGVRIDVYSKYDQFFLAPRDVSLESGGVIIDSERGSKPSPNCSPLLEPTHLKHDQTGSGIVLFQVPNEAFLRNGTVIFEPTRWGGAPRTQVRITKVDSNPPRASASKPKTNP